MKFIPSQAPPAQDVISRLLYLQQAVAITLAAAESEELPAWVRSRVARAVAEMGPAARFLLHLETD